MRSHSAARRRYTTDNAETQSESPPSPPFRPPPALIHRPPEMFTSRLAPALRALPRQASALRIARRGYAEAAATDGKLQLSLVLPHEVRWCPGDRRRFCLLMGVCSVFVVVDFGPSFVGRVGVLAFNPSPHFDCLSLRSLKKNAKKLCYSTPNTLFGPPINTSFAKTSILEIRSIHVHVRLSTRQ